MEQTEQREIAGERLAEACGRVGDADWAAALPARLADLPAEWRRALALYYGDGAGSGRGHDLFSVAEEMQIPAGVALRTIAKSLARLEAPARGEDEHRASAMRELAARAGYNSTLAFRAALRRLHPRERDLLALRYGLRPGDREGRMPAGIAREWGVTPQRIDQMHDRALAKLRRARERTARRGVRA